MVAEAFTLADNATLLHSCGMVIKVTTHLGETVARRFAMCESLGEAVYIWLIFDIPGSAEKIYQYRTTGSRRSEGFRELELEKLR